MRWEVRKERIGDEDFVISNEKERRGKKERPAEENRPVLHLDSKCFCVDLNLPKVHTKASTIPHRTPSAAASAAVAAPAAMPPPGGRRTTLCIDDYDCIGFDLDHTLCRYNVGPMIRLEYSLLADFLVDVKGYDPRIRDQRSFERDRDFVCKGLTLDCERGNLLRLAADGFILGACHGTR